VGINTRYLLINQVIWLVVVTTRMGGLSLALSKNSLKILPISKPKKESKKFLLLILVL